MSRSTAPSVAVLGSLDRRSVESGLSHQGVGGATRQEEEDQHQRTTRGQGQSEHHQHGFDVEAGLGGVGTGDRLLQPIVAPGAASCCSMPAGSGVPASCPSVSASAATSSTASEPASGDMPLASPTLSGERPPQHLRLARYRLDLVRPETQRFFIDQAGLDLVALERALITGRLPGPDRAPPPQPAHRRYLASAGSALSVKNELSPENEASESRPSASWDGRFPVDRGKVQLHGRGLRGHGRFGPRLARRQLDRRRARPYRPRGRAGPGTSRRPQPAEGRATAAAPAGA